MMIWDIIHIIYNFSIDLILGSGPFFVFKCMGSGSQSGKLIFKNSGDGKNIYTINSNNCLCIQDKMIEDAIMPSETVTVGTGKSIKSSGRFVAQSLSSGGASAKRAINLPGIGHCVIMKSSCNYAHNYRSLIINSKAAKIYTDSSSCLNKTIINSPGSKIGDSLYNNTQPPFGSNIAYSSIIGGCGICISKYTSHSTVIGTCKSKLERATRSSIVGGACNAICDYDRYQSSQSCLQFIGGGYYNQICNSVYLPNISQNTGSIGNSILSGYRNCIVGSEFSSILSSSKSKITGHGNNKNRFDFNFIGGGSQNLICSYTPYEQNYLSSNHQAIINGSKNKISGAYYSLISNGYSNTIRGSYDPISSGSECVRNTFIINGRQNCVTHQFNSGILNGKCNVIFYEKPKPSSVIYNNVVVNGYKNKICTGKNSVIINGYLNYIKSSSSTILTGKLNDIKGASYYSSIINGTASLIYASCFSTLDSNKSSIYRGLYNTIISYESSNGICSPNNKSKNNSILGGKGNGIKIAQKDSITNSLYTSVIIGGSDNFIYQKTLSCSVGILGGNKNVSRRSSLSGIFAGEQNLLGCLPTNFTGTSTYISSIIGGFSNSVQNSEDHEFKASTNVIVGGRKNSMSYAKTICNNVIIGGDYLTGRVIDSKGNCKLYCDLAQTEKLSLRGNMYVTDNSGNRCKALSSLNISSSQKINSMCVVKGIIITMSYS